jgi:large subunit ribosomal protein L22
MAEEATPKDEGAADEAAAPEAAATDAAATEAAADEATPEAGADDAAADEAPAAEAKPKAAPKAKAAAKPKADAKPAKAKADAAAAAAPTPEEVAAAESAKARTARSRGEVDARPVRAVARYVRFSAQKGRLVVDQVRGKLVVDAATTLMFSNRAAAREILKVLKSAVANAENNHGMSAEELYVSAAFVDEGPTFKRWKPRARGRVDKVNKRTCHITVVVSTAPEALLEGPRAARKAARAGKASRGSSSRSARVAASKSGASKQKSEA